VTCRQLVKTQDEITFSSELLSVVPQVLCARCCRMSLMKLWKGRASAVLLMIL